MRTIICRTITSQMTIVFEYIGKIIWKPYNINAVLRKRIISYRINGINIIVDSNVPENRIIVM